MKRHYLETREKYPWASAIDAWLIVKAKAARVVRHRLLGADQYNLPNFAVAGWMDVPIKGHNLRIQFTHDAEYLMEGYKERKLGPYGADRRVPEYSAHGRAIKLTEWSEEQAYRYYAPTVGKARARVLAIESRKQQIDEIAATMRGDHAYYYIDFKYEGINIDSVGPFRDDDKDGIREAVEDAVEFVLRSTQDFKEPA